MTDKLNDNDIQRIEQKADIIYDNSPDVLDAYDIVKRLMIDIAEYATLFERQQQAKESFDEYRKGCMHKCGDGSTELHTCGCYNNWMQDKAEHSELRNKVIELNLELGPLRVECVEKDDKIKELTAHIKWLLETLEPFENMEALGPLESMKMREIENSLKTK